MSNQDALDFDAVVVGAGMAGLYSLYHLRELGFTAVVLEQGSGVGGTWYWNRYPGARCDVPSLEYSFGFSPELEQEWEWSEVFPGQEELERYFNHVADRFDLRRDIRLNTRVAAATFDDATETWVVETEAGDRYTARYCIMATGCLSKPMRPDVPGVDKFCGEILQTSLWPREGVDFSGKRVGLIGTGSSGVQSTPELAEMAEELVVFQRTPTYTWPSFNGPLDPEVQRETKRTYREMRKGQRANPGGVVGSTGAIIMQMAEDQKILEATEEERMEVVEKLGFGASRAWSDLATNPEANEAGAELFRIMVRRTVEDPDVAEALSPRGYPIGCKRPVIDSHYFETFNRDNVTLVDLRKGGIEAITETGVQTAQGHYELDVIVFATGFDAMTGALALDRHPWTRRCIAARLVGARPPHAARTAGRRVPELLHDHRSGQPVGARQHGGVRGAARGVDRRLPHVLARPRLHDHRGNGGGAGRLGRAGEHHRGRDDVRSRRAATPGTSERNIPGKERVFMPYVGGLNRYIDQADAVAASGYEGFALS